MSDRWLSSCGTIELRQGDWREVLADVERCDAVICDPPYSPRLHSGFRSAKDFTEEKKRRTRFGSAGSLAYGGIPYKPIDGETATALVRSLSPAWWVVFGDHISFRLWEDALIGCGWYTFAPVIWVRADNEPRFQGDGPACTCEHICVARQKTTTKCGSLRGHYDIAKLVGAHPDKLIKGQKPVELMRALVRDYSRPGDLVVDPFAGGATTLLAAAIEGRRAIGSELDPETFRKAVRRLGAGWTVDFTARMQKPKQGMLV